MDNTQKKTPEYFDGQAQYAELVGKSLTSLVDVRDDKPDNVIPENAFNTEPEYQEEMGKFISAMTQTYRGDVTPTHPDKFIVKDSGQRQEFDTGAKRDTQEDKPRYDLISPLALERVALLYAKGAKKYDERNWEKGMPLNRFYASMMRHAFQYGRGDTDEDHLAAVVFNALAIMHFQELGRTDLNDMPTYQKKT